MNVLNRNPNALKYTMGRKIISMSKKSTFLELYNSNKTRTVIETM
jgi:hypothetical protein